MASRRVVFSLLLWLFFLAWAVPAAAAEVPSGFEDAQIAEGLNSPTTLAVLPDGRVLVVQQNGEIRMIKDDVLSPAPFYAVPDVDTFAERGCLGITSDPNFAVNHFIYLYCTVTNGTSSFNRVFRVTEANDLVVPGSEQVIFTLPNVPPGTQWHMGGALRFGTDGKLYIAVGGHEDNRLPAEESFSQKLSSPFGKILRINADGSVPEDNPFVATAGANGAVFALGLRNPFAIDIQPGTGLLYINDVGAGTWEEINQGALGANYGWPAFEGDADDSRYTNAVHRYSHSDGCAVTGGAFYNPATPQFPDEYVGKYFFSDFCKGVIRIIDPAAPATATEFASGIGSPVNLAVSPDGSMFYLARNQDAGVSAEGGTVGKITFTNSKLPRITLQPKSQTIFAGDSVTFTVNASDATAIQWQRNGVNIPGATAASYAIANTSQADDKAVFTAVIGNVFGSVTSRPATLTITNNRLPVATITSPAAEAGFAPGDVITYAGTGTDAEDGALPPSALTWQVDFLHDTHSHPFMAATSGAASGTLTIPPFETDAANTRFRISLTVTDSIKQTGTVTREIYPRTQLGLLPITMATNGLGPVVNKANGGGPIVLDRIPYPIGLGVVAPSDIRVNLAGACSGSFVADVGVDDTAGDRGSVQFMVFLDNVMAFDSGVMHGNDPRKTIRLAVAGKSELRLLVLDGGDGMDWDRANWAGARVTGCPAPAQ